VAVNRLKKDRVTTSGNTASRPNNPEIGDTYYDGTLGFLVIYDGTNFIPCSSPASQPSISALDVGTGRAYGSGQLTVTFTEGATGGKAAGFTATAGAYNQTSASSPITLTVGDSGTYSVSGTAYNAFGTSASSSSSSVNVTTIPQAPTIGSASTNAGTTDITVTWTLNSNGGKALSAITITPYLNGNTAGATQNAATTGSTSHTFTGLTMGSSYTFKVKTTNANGTSAESSATNSVTIPTLVTVDTLVIAGGGAGGSPMGGGGGAGGLVYTSSVNLTPGVSFTVTVGAGAGDTTEYATAASGSNSNITGSGISLTAAVGGGGGGRWNGQSPTTGGSGGGGAPNTGGAAGTAGQGSAGGSGGQTGSQFPAGGGGGAGASGSNGSSGDAADGGVGLSTYSSWGAATSSGENVGGTYYYAGGGGGGYYLDTGGTPPTAAPGGYGGGGYGGRGNDNQSIIVVGSAGTANTGGGGGGSGVYPGSSGNRVGKGGGSGIVIIRYNGTITAASTSGSPSRVESGGYTYYKFTGSGSITF